MLVFRKPLDNMAKQVGTGNCLLSQPFLTMSIRPPRKGENYELSIDLNSEYREKRKDAIKRTIASMTVGKGIWTFAYTVIRELNVDILRVRCQRSLPRRSQEHADR
jgi:hypothetical protein